MRLQCFGCFLVFFFFVFLKVRFFYNDFGWSGVRCGCLSSFFISCSANTQRGYNVAAATLLRRFNDVDATLEV